MDMRIESFISSPVRRSAENFTEDSQLTMQQVSSIYATGNAGVDGTIWWLCFCLNEAEDSI